MRRVTESNLLASREGRLTKYPNLWHSAMKGHLANILVLYCGKWNTGEFLARHLVIPVGSSATSLIF